MNIPRRNYVFQVRNAMNGQKLVGGTIRGDNMEDAASGVINLLKLEVQITGTKEFPRVEWLRDGVKVNFYIGAHPEYFLDDEGKAKLHALPYRCS